MTRETIAPRAGPRGLDLATALLALIQELLLELHPDDAVRREVGLDDSLERDLGLDSLARMELLGRIEDRFGLRMSEEAMAAAETPRELLPALAGAGPATGISAAGKAGAAGRKAEGGAPWQARTLVEVLEWHVDHHPERRHIHFEEADRPAQELTYGRLRERARSVAAGLRSLGLEPRQTVALMLPTGLDYFCAFLGIQLAGGIPVPLYPPVRPSQIEDHLRRQAAILSSAAVKHLVTFEQVLPLARLLRAQLPELGRVVTVADLEQAGDPGRLPRVEGGETAFLQFTSGSTGHPKGVVLTHDNLLANLRIMGQELRVDSRDVMVSWLPLYHDMGLIGAWMGSLYYAFPLFLMSPLSFLARPSRWLSAIHRHRGTLSAAPNFAYELCLSRVAEEELEGLDLSCWRIALNGAEPVSPSTLFRFTRRFASHGFRPEALMPVYGLAECSLGLAFPPLGRKPRIDTVRRGPFQEAGRAEAAEPGEREVLRFVSCGPPLPEHEVRIVDDTGRELGERRQGRLHFRGPSATSGYFRNREASRSLVKGDWRDSGDLAYVAGGEIFLTGRAKDLIIRAGRNIYPQEVEEVVGAIEGVRKGCVAVFGATDGDTGTERLVVLAETRLTDAAARQRLRRRIEESTYDLLGTPADEVVLAPPHTVLKTSSGKIRRAASRDLYLTGRLGEGQRAVWRQLARLGWSGLRGQGKRTARTAGSLAYAGSFWVTAGLAALILVPAVALLPGLSRRRRTARRVSRLLASATGTRIRVEGEENLPEGEAWLVASNHMSYLDGFVLTAALPPRAAFVVKSELRKSPLPHLLLRRLGALFVERFDTSRSVADARRLVEAIRQGEPLVMFPEGTFSRAPGLGPFRMGAFLTAVETGTPVVPVAVRGTRSVLRGDEWFPRKGEVRLIIGRPISPEGDDWAAAVRLRDRVREEILRSCGEPDLGH